MSRESLVHQWRRLPHPVRWAGVAVVGGALIVIGVVLLVLPGPGLVLIALGVAVLASEFAWAESTLISSTGRSFASRSASIIASAVLPLAVGPIRKMAGGSVIVLTTVLTCPA